MRVLVKIPDTDKEWIVKSVKTKIEDLEMERVTVPDMHNFVEETLEEYNHSIAKSYKDYRNYKQEFVHI